MVNIEKTRKPSDFGTGEYWQPNHEKNFPQQISPIHKIYSDCGCFSMKKMTKFKYSGQLGFVLTIINYTVCGL